MAIELLGPVVEGIGKQLDEMDKHPGKRWLKRILLYGPFIVVGVLLYTMQ